MPKNIVMSLHLHSQIPQRVAQERKLAKPDETEVIPLERDVIEITQTQRISVWRGHPYV